ncbi:S41 family peptidase [Longirhabdus pacifica]|uniref:S41 family peptidase n=1 Tax=Longirhabdus pacifica TaxID=2305227 RepID=UPI0013E8A28E|nr:S41 family peptidase [Longirhabdus pacifica]
MLSRARILTVLSLLLALGIGSFLPVLLPSIGEAWEVVLHGDENESEPTEIIETQPAFSPTDVLMQQSGVTEDELIKLLQAYKIVQTTSLNPLDSQQVIDGALQGMIDALDDPFSQYIDPEQVEVFESRLQSSFTGIGAKVIMMDGQLVIEEPIKGAPAEKVGIKPKDIVLSVNGISLEGMTTSEAVTYIKGPKGTQAKLEILREGFAEPLEIIVIRDDVKLDTVFSKIVEDNIGYIDIFEFASPTAKMFQEHLSELETQGIKGLVIDVRNNPGGMLSSVIEILDPLLPKGSIIVQEEYAEGDTKVTRSMLEGKNYPIAVLVNEQSASASEILASALKEAGNHAVVGVQTYGKGTVQNVFNLGRDGSKIRITAAKWLTTNGNHIHGVGVAPTIEVMLPDYHHFIPFKKDDTLQLEMYGEQVQNLQLILRGLGYSIDKDLYFDQQTKEALVQFQLQHGLAPTGEADNETKLKLLEQIQLQIRKDNDPQDPQLQEAVKYIREQL